MIHRARMQPSAGVLAATSSPRWPCVASLLHLRVCCWTCLGSGRSSLGRRFGLLCGRSMGGQDTGENGRFPRGQSRQRCLVRTAGPGQCHGWVARVGGELPPQVTLVSRPGASVPEIAVLSTARGEAVEIEACSIAGRRKDLQQPGHAVVRRCHQRSWVGGCSDRLSSGHGRHLTRPFGRCPPKP